MCSIGTLQITIIHKNGVIKLDSIWCEGEPIEPEVGSNDLKDKVNLEGEVTPPKGEPLPLVIIKLTRSVWSAQ